MANLCLTDRCERNCKFCFAKIGPWSEEYSPRRLTTDEICEFVDMPTSATRLECGFVGGEPLLHPDLPRIIKIFSERSIVPKIFTSGTCPVPQGMEELDEKDRFWFTANVHPPETYTRNEWKHLKTFFETFNRKVRLACTILDPDFDFSFLLDYFREYPLQPFLRVGIALPIAGGGNQFIGEEEYRDIALTFLELAKEASKHGILVGMDCGFVACMFTTDEIGLLQRYGVKPDFACRPVIDVGPDLESWYCFPLSKLPRISLRKEGSITGVYERFQRMANRIRGELSAGIFARCKDCRLRTKRLCAAGCLGMVLHKHNLGKEELSKLISA